MRKKPLSKQVIFFLACIIFCLIVAVWFALRPQV